MLEIKDLVIEFYDTDPPTPVVKGISLEIREGEIVGIVGESGSGKTMTALSVMHLLKKDARIVSGSILLDGKDLLECNQEEWEKMRGDTMSMIFQEPMTSLNPVMTIGKQVEESLVLHSNLSKEECRAKVLQALVDVELPNPEIIYRKYPHELSGGMRQRAMIASALVNHPRMMIADEPTTALDVTVQSQVLQLLKKINREYGTAILFISHDLGVVKSICDRVIVMYQGRIAEEGEAEKVFYEPQHPYTRHLLEAIPTQKTRLRKPKSSRIGGALMK